MRGGPETPTAATADAGAASAAAGDRRRHRVLLALVAAFGLFAVVRLVVTLPEPWPYITGYEYEQVGVALARGEGFSFRNDRRWLFDPADDRLDPEGYAPTAWEEPLYPLLLAASLTVFGEHGRVVMVVVHVLCFAATLGVVYQLGRRLAGPDAGLTAVALLLLIAPSLFAVLQDLTNVSLAALLVGICAWLTLRCLERPSPARAAGLGCALGVSALVQATTLGFLPLAVLWVLAARGAGRQWPWRAALTVIAVAAMIIAPWTLRNYLTFDAFVPVKNGLGFIADLTNSALADSFRGEPQPDATLAVPWTASGPGEAWSILKSQPAERSAFYAYTIDGARTDPAYAQGNEAARDKIYLQRALAFFVDEPVVAFKLMMVKAYDFYLASPRAGAVAVLALLGLVIAFRDRRVQILALLVLAYSAPYIATGPFFYRYRYPIEPLLAVLAAVGVVGCARWVAALQRRRRVAAPTASAAEAGPPSQR